MTIHVGTLVDAFGDCVGRERARTVVGDVPDAMSHDGSACTESEAIEIARRVANQPDATPFVRTAAQTVRTRIHSDYCE